MTVHFIGAGPGALDLMTVRGRALVESCPVCLYAGSLIPKDVLAWCPQDARIVDTAPLDLDAIVAECARAHACGQDVARLQSGDLSIWSAVGEQLRRLVPEDEGGDQEEDVRLAVTEVPDQLDSQFDSQFDSASVLDFSLGDWVRLREFFAA